MSSKCIHLIPIKLKYKEPAAKPGYVLPPTQPNIHKRFSKCKNRNIHQMCHNNHHPLPSTKELPPKAKIQENIAPARMPRKNYVKENPTHKEWRWCYDPTSSSSTSNQEWCNTWELNPINRFPNISPGSKSHLQEISYRVPKTILGKFILEVYPSWTQKRMQIYKSN